ncbi:MAG: zinc ribbon domain-containing protein, partial [Lachnospiraceae bacterium]|nr:zinc ribbon domain-containing protein [Lachnospiraceae bacterium]
EYAGKIIKCPVCGQELSSTDAICPSCGHEMNEVRIHPILEKFISVLNECDSNIAQEEMAFTSGALNKKLGWSSWKAPAKVLWVVLNCFTLCAPLVLYHVVIKNRHNDTSNMNIKLTLVENFQIPNEREAIIATLNFIRGKVITLASQKIKKETWRWIKLWSAKASQIHKQAVELLPNDVIVENIYRDIVLEERKAKKIFNNKVLLRFFLVVIYIAAICCFDIFLFGHIFHGNFGSSNKHDRKDEKETIKWSDMFLSEYFPEPVLTNAYVYSNSKEKCNIGQIDCSQSKYYAYCRQCKEWGFDYEILKEDDTWFTAYNSEGYKVHVSYIGGDLSVELNAPMEMSDFNWPESEIGQIVPAPQSTYGKILWEYDSGFLVYVGKMGHEDFSEYATLLHESGFNICARKGDYYFWADNADGYHISIEYEGFNIVWLRADAPDDE